MRSGDIVVLQNNRFMSALTGSMAQVIRSEDVTGHIEVSWDRSKKSTSNNQSDGTYNKTIFRKATYAEKVTFLQNQIEVYELHLKELEARNFKEGQEVIYKGYPDETFTVFAADRDLGFYWIRNKIRNVGFLAKWNQLKLVNKD